MRSFRVLGGVSGRLTRGRLPGHGKPTEGFRHPGRGSRPAHSRQNSTVDCADLIHRAVVAFLEYGRGPVVILLDDPEPRQFASENPPRAGLRFPPPLTRK